MKRQALRERAWYPYTVAACIAVVLYVALTHLRVIGGVLGMIGGFLTPIFLGAVLAYLINPLAKLFQRGVFRNVRSLSLRWGLSVALAVIAVAAFFAAILVMLIPQLINSVSTFAENLDVYKATLGTLLGNMGVSAESLDPGALLDQAVDYARAHAGQIAAMTMNAGHSLASFAIAFVMAIFFLMEKEPLKKGAARLLQALMPEKRYSSLRGLCRHCDAILLRYILFSLLDSLIVGVVNGIFMLLLGMPYAALVSFVAAATNLVPSFGPLIGAGIGAFILVLVKPAFALWFLLFTVVLQTCDAYIIKPRLFGGSLGVSGLWILIGVTLGGSFFGVPGMLLAIPAVAILLDIYHTYMLPHWEERHRRREVFT